MYAASSSLERGALPLGALPLGALPLGDSVLDEELPVLSSITS